MIYDENELAKKSSKELTQALNKMIEGIEGANEDEKNIIETLKSFGNIKKVRETISLISFLEKSTIIKVDVDQTIKSLKDRGASDNMIEVITSFIDKPSPGEVIIYFDVPLKEGCDRHKLLEVLKKFNDLAPEGVNEKDKIKLPRVSYNIKVEDIRDPFVFLILINKILNMNNYKVSEIEFKKS